MKGRMEKGEEPVGWWGWDTVWREGIHASGGRVSAFVRLWCEHLFSPESSYSFPCLQYALGGWGCVYIGDFPTGSTLNGMGGFPGGSAGEESACNAGDLDLIPGLGRFPGEGNIHPLYGLYSPWGRKESDMTEQISLHFTWMVWGNIHQGKRIFESEYTVSTLPAEWEMDWPGQEWKWTNRPKKRWWWLWLGCGWWRWREVDVTRYKDIPDLGFYLENRINRTPWWGLKESYWMIEILLTQTGKIGCPPDILSFTWELWGFRRPLLPLR